ncbi:flagellar M-ring protein [Shewanella hanedai]|nr:flagellar M-ring protein FliF C-terminal domain-containing protein [Shewanella hanedai]GGI67582.1 flagellar M-ring protein [Shewanella hanedai]
MDKITNKIRFLIISVSLVFITLIALFWVLQDSKQVLFSGLSQTTLMEYVAKLEAEGIAYQVEGTSIFVAASDSNQARVAAMEDSIQSNKITGFELYENSDLGATERAQHANYIRALQGEIERTLTGFSYVKKARVHLSLPRKKLFMNEEKLVKASVTLFSVDNYQPRTADISAIKRLVVSAVEDLKIEQVVVIDGAGQWGTFDSQASTDALTLVLRRDTESYLEQKIYQVLSPFFPTSSISASVAVKLNTNTVKIHETKAIKGEKGPGLISSEIRFEETQLNAEKKPELKSLRSEVNYAHGALTQEIEQAPGEILRLTAAVSINAKVEPEFQAEISQLVENTIGFDTERNDRVLVSFFFLPKKEQAVVLPVIAEPVVIKQVVDHRLWIFSLIGLVTLLCMATGIFYFINKREKTDQRLLSQIDYLFDDKVNQNA